MKKINLFLIIIILNIFQLIKAATPQSFCSKIRKLDDSFPDVNTKDVFYFKKISPNNFIIGTETTATVFQISYLNTDENIFILEQHHPLGNNYYVYTDAFGNIYPILGLDNIDNPSKVKYILTEGITSENKYMHALYDVENNVLKEGKFSNTFPDYKIMTALNENEYIGAVKLYDPDTNIYSIKLQIMSFSQITEGKIKFLIAKEYNKVKNELHYINNIFYIKNINKIMITRTYQKNIYLDFIDYYSNNFGSVLTSQKIETNFDISEYKFNSIELKMDNNKTYIISCFRKFNYIYCFSGYYNALLNDFIFLQEKPKLMISSCDNRKRFDINLSKLNTELAIVGCPGKNYKAIRFDIELNKYGTEITFPEDYSEFVVLNDFSLFVTYREYNSDNHKFNLYGCIYYLPVCEDKKVFLKISNSPHSLNDAFGVEENLINMKNIYTISFTSNNGANFYNKDDNTVLSISQTISRNNLEYRYTSINPSSFEDILLYKTVVNYDTEAEAFSEECTLKIINCYKSCSECDDIGNEISHNCIKCKLDEDLISGEARYYFLEDPSSKNCYNGDINFYYLDETDENNILYKRCYESCQTCTKAGNSDSHNCLSCYMDKNYYPFNTIVQSGTETLNCYLDLLPPEGFYFDKKTSSSDNDYSVNPYFKPCDGNCLKCDQDLVESNEEFFCKICDINNKYYALFENDDSKKYAKCLNEEDEFPENYFLDKDAGRYRKCYSSCKTCSQSGDELNNNCDICKEGLNKYIINQKTCKCDYNFYYKLDSNNNNNSFKCTEDISCPNDYQYLIINSLNIRAIIANMSSLSK